MATRATLSGVNAWRIIAVALGGALGTLGRLGADQATEPLAFGNEIATLVVNLLGAFALGLASGHGLPALPRALREGLTTGLLGSYTTMSGILAAWSGVILGRRAPGATPAEVAA